MKVAVIGCTHAGTAAIKNTLALYPDAEIEVFERNDTVSFLSCGIALYVGGVVEKAESLFYASVEGFEEQGIKMHMQHEVLNVDIDKKQLAAKDLSTGESTNYDYDKLIITTGSWPITPPIPGSDLENVVLCKNYDHAKDIIRRSEHVDNVTVVGGGYIGVELVEAFEENGKNVTLIDAESRILNRYLDKTFTDPVEASFREKGVSLLLNEMVSGFEGNGKVEKVITNKSEVKADLVVMCIGFRPNTDLIKGQVDMLPNGAIVVDEYMRTSVKDVYAAGDCCAVPYTPTKQPAYIPLATNAVRMGTLVAQNLVEAKLPHPGTQGTSGLKIYDHYIGSTGLTETAAEVNKIKVRSAYLEETYRPDFMPENNVIKLKLVYEVDSHRVVGAQVISDTDLTQVVNTVSVAISNDMTIEQLALTDFFFQPHFNKPVNYLNEVALKAMQQEVKETVIQ
ncbi:FAD-dependent oxidoreductase [Amphibacillus jilinensis]|uniref:FAD-dependent oxidoreductase n=1 Tax=Amphibacillus jilinensis TaxID=1216008 RepID=UPI0002F122D4|nr:FAD-dependent oxidoreductase [Amphibacillus jilinensis]